MKKNINFDKCSIYSSRDQISILFHLQQSVEDAQKPLRWHDEDIDYDEDFDDRYGCSPHQAPLQSSFVIPMIIMNMMIIRIITFTMIIKVRGVEEWGC